MSTTNEMVDGGIPWESTFWIGGKEYHGVKDSVAGVLLLDGRPEIGDVWETQAGPYHVSAVRLPQRGHDRYVIFMAPGTGEGPT